MEWKYVESIQNTYAKLYIVVCISHPSIETLIQFVSFCPLKVFHSLLRYVFGHDKRRTSWRFGLNVGNPIPTKSPSDIYVNPFQVEGFVQIQHQASNVVNDFGASTNHPTKNCPQK